MDLLVTDARLMNTLSGDVHPVSVAVAEGVVVGFGDYEARTTFSARGRYMCPGLVEGHIHIESTMLAPHRFAETVARRGTTAVVCDPHEIANVLGTSGIEYMIKATADLPVAVYFMIPSCVPATHLETAGAQIEADDVAGFFRRHPERVLGLAEVMNVPGVLFKDPRLLAKIRAAAGRPIDGHAPLVSGKDLAAYRIAGPGSDHECTTIEEAREKLRMGFHVMIREGTAEKNLDDLIGLALMGGEGLSLVSDDRHPVDLIEKGHLDYSVRRAIERGAEPVNAVRMASLNTARYFGLRDRGAVAPGYRADFFFVDDLESFNVSDVFLGGRPLEEYAFDSRTRPPANAVRLGRIDPERFHVPVRGERMRIIGLVPGQILTEARVESPARSGGLAVADPARDLAKLAVIERHTGSGGHAVGFVQGLGLRRGAIASTVSHDSHNLVVAGMDDGDMSCAADRVVEMGGGMAVAADGRVLESVPLPIGGLMADVPADSLAAGETRLNASAAGLGPAVTDSPFMVLSFLALPVIPALKLTDRGLVDVGRFEYVDLFTADS